MRIEEDSLYLAVVIQKLLNILKSHKMLTLLSNGSSAVIGLITYGLVARVLTEEELGIWAFFLTVFTLYDMSRTGLLSNAMIKMWGEVRDKEEQQQLLGSAWQLAGITSLAFTFLAVVLFFAYPHFPWPLEYARVPVYFGIVVLFSLPQTISMWVLNAEMQFQRLLYLRFLVIIPYLIGAAALFWYFGEAGSIVNGETESGVLAFVFYIYLGSYLIASVLCILLGWSGLKTIVKGHASKRMALFDFGKYSMGTLISSNLLKSSDTFLLMFMRGPVAVAIYNIPERLLGILEIPVRSMVQATYPKLNRLYVSEPERFKDEMHAETGLLTILLLPLVLGVLLFADWLVVWLGGEKYQESANVLRIFAVYMAFVPMDRYAGVSMDAIGKPKLNFRKVILMLCVNLIGDTVVLLLGGGVLEVAMISVLTFGSGVFYGFYLLRGDFQFSPLYAMQMGWKTIKKVRLVFF